MGSLSSIAAPKLGAIAIKGALEKINLNSDLVQEVFMGHVVQAGTGQAPARQAAITIARYTGGLLPHLLTRSLIFSGWLFSSLFLYPHGYLSFDSAVPFDARTFLPG